MSTAESLDPLAAITRFGIPGRPNPAVDRALDATERCLARHGVRRTTMSDIAKEMGVSRPTLYKQVASVEEAMALVLARQLYAMLDQVQTLVAQGPDPETFIDLAVHAVTFARSWPVAERVLTYEPELIGDLITSGQMATYIEQVIDLVAPLLQAAMDVGAIRSGDPRLTAEVTVRLCGSLVLTPATGDVEQLVRYALEPLLVPAATAKSRKAR
jgi:AcrR family transcriptional regulator